MNSCSTPPATVNPLDPRVGSEAGFQPDPIFW
eukprot:COSAG05_NODE_7358_length_823_cov_0.890884_1_plen_31_part_01